MLVDDSVQNRKTQAGTHAGRLGCEEWIKNSQDHLRRNARTIIGDFHSDAILGNLFRPDPNVAAFSRLPDGLLRIHDKVEQSLLNLCGIRDRFRELPVQIELHANILQAQLVRTDLQCALYDFVQVHRGAFALAAA